MKSVSTRMHLPGKAANSYRKIALMRAATTAAETRYSSGGGAKVRGPRAKPVTLLSLETVRKLTLRLP